MAELTRYRFESVWRVRADPGSVWDVLYDVPSYPEWWPQVKAVTELRREESYRVVVRSLLPYTLEFTLGQSVAERDQGVLEASLSGELEGFSRYTIRPAPAGSVLRFAEEVLTRKPILNRLAPLARPAFEMNHWWMMRNGERGLRTFMAGLRFAKEGPRGRHQELRRIREARHARAGG